ncbi:MAG TPA: type I secretion system permease/ATPase, partial [Rhizobiales bacterium]|nr:type I secretion system permease/ATPase [Hyphomicrobiales bacterium]
MAISDEAGAAPDTNPRSGKVAPDIAADHVFSDSLLGCLEFVAAHYDRSVQPGALVSGLPLVDGRLTPGLFSRAAARAGLSARIVRRPVEQLSALLLPAVLLLD